MSLPCEAYAIDKVELRNQASKTLLSNLNRNMVPAKNVITAANHVYIKERKTQYPGWEKHDILQEHKPYSEGRDS